jgi:hypothetical protein
VEFIFLARVYISFLTYFIRITNMVVLEFLSGHYMNIMTQLFAMLPIILFFIGVFQLAKYSENVKLTMTEMTVEILKTNRNRYYNPNTQLLSLQILNESFLINFGLFDVDVNLLNMVILKHLSFKIPIKIFPLQILSSLLLSYITLLQFLIEEMLRK